MKKLTFIILNIVMVFIIFMVLIISSYAEDDFILKMQINNPIMTINGIDTSIDENGTMPIIINERTLVPIRAIIETMGGTVIWNDKSKMVTLNYGNNEIRLIIDSETAYLNNEPKVLDSVPVIINNHTMLPIRFIAESFNFTVRWDSEKKIITITKETISSTEITEYSSFNGPDLFGEIQEYNGKLYFSDGNDCIYIYNGEEYISHWGVLDDSFLAKVFPSNSYYTDGKMEMITDFKLATVKEHYGQGHFMCGFVYDGTIYTSSALINRNSGVFSYNMNTNEIKQLLVEREDGSYWLLGISDGMLYAVEDDWTGNKEEHVYKVPISGGQAEIVNNIENDGIVFSGVQCIFDDDDEAPILRVNSIYNGENMYTREAVMDARYYNGFLYMLCVSDSEDAWNISVERLNLTDRTVEKLYNYKYDETYDYYEISLITNDNIYLSNGENYLRIKNDGSYEVEII